MRFCLMACFLFLLLHFNSARAEMYFYKDASGGLHAVDSPGLVPKEFSSSTKELKPTVISQSNSIDVPIKRFNNSLLLDVNFNGRTSAVMVLDTGAGSTMISKRLQAKLKLNKTGSARLLSASSEMEVSTVLLDSISVKNFAVNSLKASVNDLPGLGDLGVEGLLGLDFLSHFKFQIDTEKEILHLERKAN